jgi:hypothetical protein
MRAALENLDVVAARREWAATSPHLPQPKDDAEALATLHYARTLAESMTLRQRAYSHRWLNDRGLPSGLPDNLKPRAERIYPKIVTGVGTFARGNSELGRAIAAPVQQAMSDAVAECYADGHEHDIPIIRARILEARDITMRRLIGRITTG